MCRAHAYCQHTPRIDEAREILRSAGCSPRRVLHTLQREEHHENANTKKQRQGEGEGEALAGGDGWCGGIEREPTFQVLRVLSAQQLSNVLNSPAYRHPPHTSHKYSHIGE